jgi:hypothetical protein
MGAAERHASAELRVARALEHVQRAQDEMDMALAQLSSIRGAAPMGERGRKAREAIRSFWYRLDGANRRKWELDREPEAAVKPTETKGT